MDREKKIILLSHCIINQNSVVLPLARAKGPFPFVGTIIKNNIGIYQFPCPELKFGGLNRKPMPKEKYDTPKYRELCASLSNDIISDLVEYIKNDYKIIGIIGVKHSPTCSISEKRGIFMEELFKMLDTNNISIPYIEVPEEYPNSNEAINYMENMLSSIMDYSKNFK